MYANRNEYGSVNYACISRNDKIKCFCLNSCTHVFKKLTVRLRETGSYRFQDIYQCDAKLKLSRFVGKPTMWFPARSDTNWPVHSQKRARILKHRI